MQSPFLRRLETRLLARQHLAPETVRKTIASLRALERDGLDLERPDRDGYDEILARRAKHGARAAALQNAYKAVRRLLRAHGLAWPDFECPRVPASVVKLPSDDVVAQFLRYGERLELERAPDDVEVLDARLARFAFTFGFYSALRPPSEHVALRVRDWNRASRELTVYAPKTERTDVLQLEPWLAAIVNAYVDDLRERVDIGVSEQLLLDVHGKPWTANRYRMWLSRHGKSVWSSFHPYTMRHWGATYRLIETGFDVYALKDWMRHAKLATTEKYVHVASARLRARMLEHEVQPLGRDAKA